MRHHHHRNASSRGEALAKKRCELDVWLRQGTLGITSIAGGALKEESDGQRDEKMLCYKGQKNFKNMDKFTCYQRNSLRIRECPLGSSIRPLMECYPIAVARAAVTLYWVKE